ncbi:MAG TPA: hypothetical protein VFF32_01585 [Dermatophilaceae bacterium]|nr:hypothetical protein [Dermatophilaceae bacterium]
MNRQDARSVGELLLDADFTTRQVLMDVTSEDAPAMLRTWGEVVQSASELWATLPPPVGGGSSPIDGATMARLESMSQAMHRTQVRQGWPGDGPADERLLHVAETLTRAADLIGRRGGHIRPSDPEVRADLDAARMRIMHTLYVGAHGVGVAARHHVRDVELSTRGKTSQESRGVPRGQDAVKRLAAFEQLAGAYVGNRYARAAQGEHVRGPYGAERLQQALIGWDIQAHRTLAASPTAANLLLVSRTQAGIATAAGAILQAGARTGHVDTHAYEHRLAPTLDATQENWTHVAGRWAEMTSPADRTDMDLVAAANELRAAVREIAHDKTTWARPDVMAGRVDLGEAAQHLQQALSSAVEVACVIRDVAAQDTNLTGPARAMSHRANAEVDGAADHGQRGEDVVWVAPGDVFANRPVTIPEPVRAGLVDATDTLVQTAGNAMSAAACLDRVTQDRAPGSGQEPTAPRSRRHEEPTHMAQEVPRVARP